MFKIETRDRYTNSRGRMMPIDLLETHKRFNAADTRKRVEAFLDK